MCKLKQLVCLFIIVLIVAFFINIPASAQYWQAMPPYNLLWPLWVRPLSPGGVPAISSLTEDTVLPVQPSWVWNINLDYPWFLYDMSPGAAGGLFYWDLLIGFRPFDQTSPLPTATLPWYYRTLAPDWGTIDFATWTNLANIYFDAFTVNAGYASPLTQLFTPAAIWGTPPFL